MPKKSELKGYLELPVQELFDLLSSDRTTIIFRSLCTLCLRNLDDPAIRTEEAMTLLATIVKDGVTFKNRKMAYNLFCQIFPERIDEIVVGQSRQVGYVYFLQEKKYGSVKIGRSLNIDNRLVNFIGELPYPIELIGYIMSINYEMIELALHKHFRSKRLGGEWFDLDESEIFDIRRNIFPKTIEELIVT